MSKKNMRIKKGNKKHLIILSSIFFVFLFVCFLSYYKNNRWFIKVGNHSINKAQYDMWRTMIEDDFIDELNSGDISDDFADLAIDKIGEENYNEYFDLRTNMEVYTTLAILNEIDSNKFELNNIESNEKLTEKFEKINQEAYSSDLDFNSYIKYKYSKNLNEQDAIDILQYQIVSHDYLYSLVKDDITDNDYEEYYKEHNEKLDIAEAYVITLENNDDNLELMKNFSVSSEQEFINKAIELQGSDGFMKYYTESECPSSFSSFLFLKSSSGLDKSNDKDYIYLVWKHDLYRYDEKTVNAYIMMFVDGDASDNLNNANNILDEFNSGNKTKEFFIALSEKYAGNSGLLENIREHDTYTNISDWLFDEKRGHGDVTIQAYGKSDVYLIYWDSYGLDAWKAISLDRIINDKFDDIQKVIRDKYEFRRR